MLARLPPRVILRESPLVPMIPTGTTVALYKSCSAVVAVELVSEEIVARFLTNMVDETANMKSVYAFVAFWLAILASLAAVNETSVSSDSPESLMSLPVVLLKVAKSSPTAEAGPATTDATARPESTTTLPAVSENFGKFPATMEPVRRSKLALPVSRFHCVPFHTNI